VEDLRVPVGWNAEFRRLFVGHRLRAYHATRLLDHEVAMIRGQGLRLLDEDLVVGRIKSAHESGHLSRVLRDRLLTGHVFAEADEAMTAAEAMADLRPSSHDESGLGHLIGDTLT
jgi:hypothetical protein